MAVSSDIGNMLHKMLSDQGQEMRDGFARVHARLDEVVKDQSTLRAEVRAALDNLNCLEEGRCQLSATRQPVGDWLTEVMLAGVKIVLVGAVAAVLVWAVGVHKGP